ncbi:hypothetical protein RZS08_45610, partial [Arthrospira platensis SPKY1]|nr:hypothetical protein [Arthrospira platensis SPKY1]
SKIKIKVGEQEVEINPTEHPELQNLIASESNRLLQTRVEEAVNQTTQKLQDLYSGQINSLKAELAQQKSTQVNPIQVTTQTPPVAQPAPAQTAQPAVSNPTQVLDPAVLAKIIADSIAAANKPMHDY